MKTQENLMEAFAGESQANRKYLAFAEKAEKEGYSNIARIFRAIAEAETIHALKHLATAEKVGSTLENLETAVEGEHLEYTEMYPEFIETARQEGQSKAARSFSRANAAEKVHGSIFKKLRDMAVKENDAEDKDVYLCPICGWVGMDSVPDNCPICNTAKKAFKTF